MVQFDQRHRSEGTGETSLGPIQLCSGGRLDAVSVPPGARWTDVACRAGRSRRSSRGHRRYHIAQRAARQCSRASLLVERLSGVSTGVACPRPACGPASWLRSGCSGNQRCRPPGRLYDTRPGEWVRAHKVCARRQGRDCKALWSTQPPGDIPARSRGRHPICPGWVWPKPGATVGG